MPDDIDFVMTYPCYFLYSEDHTSLQCNTVNNHECLCLFTSEIAVQRFQQAKNLHLHGPEHVDLEVAVDPVADYDGLIGRLKSGEADLAKCGIRHLAIDPVPGQLVLYIEIREFIEQLPR
jgi:hypothetical protein